MILDWTWMFGAEWRSLVWWMICRVIILGAVETTARWDRDTYLPQTLSFYLAATISLWRVILIEITPSQKERSTCRDLEHRVTLKRNHHQEKKIKNRKSFNKLFNSTISLWKTLKLNKILSQFLPHFWWFPSKTSIW